MAGCFPFRMCLECLQGPSFTATQSYAHLREEVYNIKLDTGHMGPDVILLKNGSRICGIGAALATAPIVQNKAFFQVHILQTGTWGVGLATKTADLSKVPLVSNAWTLNNEGVVMADGKVVGRMDTPFQEGDTIGIGFDHVELKFFKKEEAIPISVSNIRGQVYPMLYVDDNAILDAKFSSFDIKMPFGYEEIMIEQTLL